jgi:hypothetical protein
MPDAPDVAALREKLAMYRRLRPNVTDPQAQNALDQLINDIEAQLKRLSDEGRA